MHVIENIILPILVKEKAHTDRRMDISEKTLKGAGVGGWAWEGVGRDSKSYCLPPPQHQE